MALIKCHECGNQVSTEAASCPKCGAKPKIKKKSPNIFGVITIIVIAIIIMWPSSKDVTEPKAEPLSVNNIKNEEAKPEPKEVAKPETKTDFSKPLITKEYAMVCPSSIALDKRQGYGIEGAFEAKTTIWSHEEAIKKVGCEEWKEGIPITISDEEKMRAAKVQNGGKCTMLLFNDSFIILSCDLKNELEANNPNVAVEQLQDVNDNKIKLNSAQAKFECNLENEHESTYLTLLINEYAIDADKETRSTLLAERVLSTLKNNHPSVPFLDTAQSYIATLDSTYSMIVPSVRQRVINDLNSGNVSIDNCMDLIQNIPAPRGHYVDWSILDWKTLPAS